MLKEGDRQGLWRIMESSLRYDTRTFDITICRIFLHIIFVSLSLVLEHLPWLMPYFRLLTKAKLRKSPLADHSQRRIDQRLKEGPTSRDLFYYLVRPIPILCIFPILNRDLLKNNEDGADPQPPPRTQLLSDGVLAIIAGSDTTASVLSNAFYLLMRNPQVMQKIKDEIDRYYPANEDPTDSCHYPAMEYVDAVM